MTLCLSGVAPAAMPHGACQGPVCELQIGCADSARAQVAPLPPAVPTVVLAPGAEPPVPASSRPVVTVGHAEAPPDRPVSPLAPRSPPAA